MKRRFLKKFITNFLAITVVTSLSLTGCSSGKIAKDGEDEEKHILAESLDISKMGDKWSYNETYDCYSLENIVYVENPEDSQKQSMNIYVPSKYMNEDGTINTENTINNYNSETAPIIYVIGVGGYAEANPSTISDKTSEYLKQGYIVASPGARGRQTMSEDGSTYIGKSPAAIVDLKAGVRFLKANEENLAGSSERIISIGTSAGGALSSLLAATGNSSDYDKYLEEIGAVMWETDDVYAAQAYCPITDLDHADMAYEWMFNGSTNENNTEVSEFTQAISNKLVPEYITYLNSLGLKNPETGEELVMGEDGRSGTMYDYLMKKLEESATKYITSIEDGTIETDYTAEDYLSGNAEGIPTGSSTSGGLGGGRGLRGEGIGAIKKDKESIDSTLKDNIEQLSGDIQRPGFGGMMKNSIDVGTLNKTSWLSWDGENATITSFQDLLNNYLSRSKTALAFDDLDLTQAENQEFGDVDTDVMHFDSYIADIIDSLKEEFPEEYEKYYKGYAAVKGDIELAERKQLLNPFNYISSNTTDIPKNIRIRVGTQDSDTAFTISMTLALMFDTYTDSNVDYELCWDQGHGDADYNGEFIAWVDSICSQK